MKRLLAALILILLAAPAHAQDFQKGMEAHKRGDYAAALRVWQPLAEQGNAEAQTFLGVMHGSGLGVPLDNTEAVKWYRLAAQQGFAPAQLNLGNAYREGRGVRQDHAEAAKLYRLAAKQGLARAQYTPCVTPQ